MGQLAIFDPAIEVGIELHLCYVVA
ncbi:uncharacterized protein METZ01_LOCUS507815 [marine metagenome]|uniref:Uncharacterized protein n=1 Tax=marine metagenome TaxID=408172 RepID=A0A383EE03_9ZZZZ